MVKFLFQPPAPPVSRHSGVSRYDLPSLPKTVLPPWVVKRPWAQPLPLLSRIPQPPPPPSRRFNDSTLSERPKVTKKRSVHAEQQRPCDRVKKVHRKEKSGIAVAQHSSKEQSRQPPTDKKALRQKKQLAQAKADSTTVVAPAGTRRKVNTFRTATSVPVVAGARAHGSKTKTYSSVPKVIGTSDSEVSESASTSCCVSEASVPSVSPPFSAGLSEGGLDFLKGGSPSSPKRCPNCRKTRWPKQFKQDFWL